MNGAADLTVTVRDVARHAAVSSGTVSRVLNDEDGVAEELRARVLHAVEHLGYVHTSRRRKTAAASEIGFLLVVRDIEEGRPHLGPFWADILFGAEQAARDSGSRVIFRALHGLDKFPDSARKQIADLKLRGALLAGPAPARTVQVLREAGIRLVLVDNAIPGEADTAVLSDNFYGISMAIDHLVALGHRDIAFVGGPPHPGQPGSNAIHSIWWRALGFRTAMREHDLPVRPGLVEGCDLTAQGGAAAARRLLRSGRFTAVVAANDPTAAGVMQALSAAGIRVPAEVSVAGYDDDPSVHTEPALTTVRVDTQALARLAMRLAVDAVNSVAPQPMTCTLPGHLIIRDSTGPAPATRSITTPDAEC
jgi:DNA-binding LacI/PurR family transcriptional regulator